MAKNPARKQPAKKAAAKAPEKQAEKKAAPAEVVRDSKILSYPSTRDLNPAYGEPTS